jgi:hypothetical protein
MRGKEEKKVAGTIETLFIATCLAKNAFVRVEDMLLSCSAASDLYCNVTQGQEFGANLAI